MSKISGQSLISGQFQDNWERCIYGGRNKRKAQCKESSYWLYNLYLENNDDQRAGRQLQGLHPHRPNDLMGSPTENERDP